MDISFNSFLHLSDNIKIHLEKEKEGSRYLLKITEKHNHKISIILQETHLEELKEALRKPTISHSQFWSIKEIEEGDL